MKNEAQHQVDLLKTGALQTAILNSANFSSIATDEKGVIQIFNIGAERMLGYAAADVLNKITPADISDPGEILLRAQALSTEFDMAIAPGFEALVFKASRGIEDIYELIYVCKDGSRLPAVVSVTALRDARQAIIGYLLIGSDNTARKRAEEALIRAGALQNAIFNSANFSSIATDAKGVIQIFNVGAERMLGYAAADVVNKITPADISDPQEVIARAKALSAELGTVIAPGFDALVFKATRGIEDIYELTYIRKDGSRFPAVLSVTALRDDSGEVIGYLLIATDNTARLQASQYARSLLEASLDPLVTINPDGKITDINEGSIKVTGVARSALIGTDFSDYFTEPAKAREGYQQVFALGSVVDYPLTIRHCDGRLTDVLYNASLYKDSGGTVLGVFAAARDITARKLVEAEQKRLDQALRETNLELQGAKVEAERANLAKSDFLSSMSHELRSPLNAILGFAQLMDSESPPLTAGQKESTSQILQAGWYLLELINEILDLAQIESGKLPLSLEPLSLDEVLADCEAMIEPQARKSGIRVVFGKPELPLFASVDRTRVKQVFVNLLSNAIKYNRVGGSVQVSSRACPGNRVRVSFQDTGEGLNPDKLAQLFQPFNRLGQEAGVEEGTGIGLVVSKQLVELMGGLIGVESTVGVGSVFWIELNASEVVETGSDDALHAVATLSDTGLGAPLRTVLYVEDNPANLMLVTKLLARRPDISLLIAKDGRSGVEMAQAKRPDVILMDINLPGISGVTALQILAADPCTAHIPVIAVSANAMPRDIEKGLEAGFFRYITKPIKVTEFMDALDLGLDCASARSEIASGEQTT